MKFKVYYRTAILPENRNKDNWYFLKEIDAKSYYLATKQIGSLIPLKTNKRTRTYFDNHNPYKYYFLMFNGYGKKEELS